MSSSIQEKTNDARPLIAIVGRPNVGKSTLFNRLIGKRVSIVDDQPGVTRDRICGEIEWDGREFDLVDTGGLIPDSSDNIGKRVYEQIMKAIQDAACVILVTDANDGVTPGDQEVALVLKKSDKHVIVAVNKADNEQRELVAAEMYSLGFDKPFPISALHGLGIGELLDEVSSAVPHSAGREPRGAMIKIAIVGQPNVGKSSLVNSLLKEERVIVDETAGTTRDSIDILLRRGDETYLLIDTAGLRKPKKIERGIELYSVKRALSSIRRCDVALLLIDSSASFGISEQDCRIANQIDSNGRAQIVVLNKWDVAEKDHRTYDAYVSSFRRKMPNLSYVPTLSISAVTGLRLNKILDEVVRVHANYVKRITTSELNEFMHEIFLAHPPPLPRNTGVNGSADIRADYEPRRILAEYIFAIHR
jgi:GTP-binding protein